MGKDGRLERRFAEGPLREEEKMRHGKKFPEERDVAGQSARNKWETPLSQIWGSQKET